MPVPEISVLYAGILAIMGIGLGATCGIYRGKAGISFGDGGDPELAMRMRRHANFLENAPIAIIVIALLEMQSVPDLAIYLLGGAVVLGRGLHAWRFSGGVADPIRGLGAGITALSIVIASIWGIVAFFS